VSLLELEHVTKRYRRGDRETDALRDVSLTVETGEVVTISGARGSGRTTLIRIIGGLLRPDGGEVRVAGVELFQQADAALRRQVAVAGQRFLPAHGTRVYEHVMVPLLALGVPTDAASMRAHRALRRAGAEDLALAAPNDLVPAETARVALARAIVREPRLLLVDEPTIGLEPLERDPLLSLIQAIAQESGIATVLTAGETTSVTGADRCLRLSGGTLIGRPAPPPAEIISLRRTGTEPA
jgi:ABC-type methionine transport system ATPase subunit